MNRDQRVGWRSDCLEQFEKGHSVSVLCRARERDGGAVFYYRVNLRKRGFGRPHHFQAAL
jgi:hypothetical protein